MVGWVVPLFFMPHINFSQLSNLDSTPFSTKTPHHQQNPTNHHQHHHKPPSAKIIRFKPFSQSFPIKYTQITQKSLKSPKNRLKSLHLPFSYGAGSEIFAKTPFSNPFPPIKTPNKKTSKFSQTHFSNQVS